MGCRPIERRSDHARRVARSPLGPILVSHFFRSRPQDGAYNVAGDGGSWEEAKSKIRFSGKSISAGQDSGIADSSLAASIARPPELEGRFVFARLQRFPRFTHTVVSAISRTRCTQQPLHHACVPLQALKLRIVAIAPERRIATHEK